MTATPTGDTSQGQTVPCPSCGARTTGKFCNVCGTPLKAEPCGKCGAPMAPSARFCSRCGSPPGAGTGGSARTAWTVAGAAVIALLAVLLVMLRRGQPTEATPAAAAEAPATDGAPPDISAMSPRERFDRLYNRIMQAAESGDNATATRFTPMALMAYAQLDTIDSDARYHAALIKIHTGDVNGSLALADTVLSQTPGHLFGFVIRGTVARWRKDDAARSKAEAEFLSHYDAEMKADRPEYREHKAALDEFRRSALARRT